MVHHTNATDIHTTQVATAKQLPVHRYLKPHNTSEKCVTHIYRCHGLLPEAIWYTIRNTKNIHTTQVLFATQENAVWTRTMDSHIVHRNTKEIHTTQAITAKQLPLHRYPVLNRVHFWKLVMTHHTKTPGGCVRYIYTYKYRTGAIGS